MNANKSLIAFVFCALAASPALAQGAAAPSLFNVEEVAVQPLHFGNDSVAKSCGLSQDELQNAMLKALRDDDVPAILEAGAAPPAFNRARIDFSVDIFSSNNEGLECTSWISLTAQTRNTVHVPPVDRARDVTIVYWREGSMLASAQSIHQGLLTDTLQKLARHFAVQYKHDQPPATNDKDK